MSSAHTTEIDAPARLRFGIFELDERSGELKRDGVVVRLPGQPFKVLWLLASRAGEVVTREEIRQAVWGDDTFVDFDGSLNFCVAQIRKALRDSAESPRFVHTLPRRGYRFIAEVRHELPIAAAAPDEPEEPRAGVYAVVVPPLERALPRRARVRPVLVGLAVVAAAAAAALGWMMRPQRAAPTYTRLTFRRGFVEGARFAPGGQVVYSGAWDGEPSELYQGRVGGGDPRSLGVASAAVKGVLPSGDVAALQFRDDGSNVLLRVPASSGAPRAVREDVTGADWQTDGLLAVNVRKGPEEHVEFPAGHEVYHVRGWISHLRIAPDGSRVAFLEHPVQGDDLGDVVTVDRAGRRSVLTAGWASLEGLAWRPDGREVWFTGARVGSDLAVQAVTLDGRTREVLAGPGRLVLHDVARDGRILLARTTRQIKIVASTPAGERDLTWLDTSIVTSVASDGSAIVICESGEGAGEGYAVFLRKTDGSPAERLGPGRADQISPDGRFVLSMPISDPPRVVALPTGPGEPRTLGVGLVGHVTATWFPDSRRVALLASEPGRRLRVFVQDLDGGPIRPVTPEGMGLARPLVSPDALQVLARTEGPQGRWSLYPVAGGPPAPMQGLEGPARPMTWSANGAWIYTARTGPATMIERVAVATGQREVLRTLRGATRFAIPSITPDGRTLVYTLDEISSDVFQVTGLR